MTADLVKAVPRDEEQLAIEIFQKLALNADLSGLNPQQKIEYYGYRCRKLGLDPGAKPFDIIRFDGKEVLYALKSCTDQLTAVHRLSVEVLERLHDGELYIVRARCTSPDKRFTDNDGVISLAEPERCKVNGTWSANPKFGKNLNGLDRANAMMKATTKAIRRAVLSHMGLGMMDETEVEGIPAGLPPALPGGGTEAGRAALGSGGATLAAALPPLPEPRRHCKACGILAAEVGPKCSDGDQCCPDCDHTPFPACPACGSEMKKRAGGKKGDGSWYPPYLRCRNRPVCQQPDTRLPLVEENAFLRSVGASLLNPPVSTPSAPTEPQTQPPPAPGVPLKPGEQPLLAQVPPLPAPSSPPGSGRIPSAAGDFPVTLEYVVKRIRDAKTQDEARWAKEEAHKHITVKEDLDYIDQRYDIRWHELIKSTPRQQGEGK